MKRCILYAALCLAFSLALASIVRFWSPPDDIPELSPSESPQEPPVSQDAETALTLLRGGEIVTLTMKEYLPGVLAGEMPASFSPEALRAQAAAARTYALYRMARSDLRHPQADLCDDPACCQVWLSDEELRVRWGDDYERYRAVYSAAAEDTDGIYLAWEGEPILACFHASSPGLTESCQALWGTALPYLVSVETPEGEADVPGFVTTAEFSPEEMKAAVESAFPETDLTASPSEWIGETVKDESGRVAEIRIGSAALPGSKVRELFSLRSTCFTLAWEDGRFRFTVFGSGHGVGMSQYGADAMARAGSGWREILTHYYPGAVLREAGR